MNLPTIQSSLAPKSKQINAGSAVRNNRGSRQNLKAVESFPEAISMLKVKSGSAGTSGTAVSGSNGSGGQFKRPPGRFQMSGNRIPPHAVKNACKNVLADNP